MCVAAIRWLSIACWSVAGVRMSNPDIIRCNPMRRTPSHRSCHDRRLRRSIRRSAAQLAPPATIAVGTTITVAGMVAWTRGMPRIDVGGAERRIRRLRTNRDGGGAQAPRCRPRG